MYNNKYTANLSSEEFVLTYDRKQILLDILRKDFPDDEYFKKGMLGPEDDVNKLPIEKQQTVVDNFIKAERNSKNIINVTSSGSFVDYKLEKSFPTISNEELDDIIDEEWEFFIDPPEEPIDTNPRISNIFLTTTPVGLQDVHHMYLQFGPQQLNSGISPDNVFCVFYIENGIAKPIPNYKTLEVMLVERGFTYTNIQNASEEQIKEYDLLLDGRFSDINETPTDEFKRRQVDDRSSEWDNFIRFNSGYRPRKPFVRDPGDYVKTNLRNTDPLGNYYDKVFRRQLYREKLREQFEGKLIILDWPSSDIFTNSEVTQGTSTTVDDLVQNLRMLINGHWKQVRDISVIKLYASLNGYDISRYRPKNTGRYGEYGLINLLVNSGGITNIQSSDLENSNTNTNDVLNETEPIWNAFAHIVESDVQDDGIAGLDIDEYRDYLDSVWNGGQPFNISELQPYEPIGSIKYYPEDQYLLLSSQAIRQNDIDKAKDIILDIWPGIVSKIDELRISLDSTKQTYIKYLEDLLGTNSPIYKIWVTDSGSWKFVRKDKIKTAKDNFFKNERAQEELSAALGGSDFLVKDINKIVADYEWMRTVDYNHFKLLRNAKLHNSKVGLTQKAKNELAVYSENRLRIQASFDEVYNKINNLLADDVTIQTWIPGYGLLFDKFELTKPTPGAVSGLKNALPIIDKSDGLISFYTYIPNGRYIHPHTITIEEVMKNNSYVRACIFKEIQSNLIDFEERCKQVDAWMPWISDFVTTLYERTGIIDDAIETADNVTDYEKILNAITVINELLTNSTEIQDFITESIKLKIEISDYLIDNLNKQYKAIQFWRKTIIEKQSKPDCYGMVWATGAIKSMNSVIPGLTYDNYLPPTFTG